MAVVKIRTRLALYFTGVVAVILFLISYSIYHFSKASRSERFSHKLKNRALTDARLLFVVRDIDERLLKQIDNNTINELFDEEIAIFNEKNVCVYKNYDKGTNLLSVNEFKEIRDKGELTRNERNRDLAGVLFPYEGTTYVVVVRAYDRYGYLYINNLRLIIWVALMSSLIVTMLVSYFFAERALLPIKKVIDQANLISANRLDLRIDEGNGEDEIASLAITFNRMLTRIQNAFVTQKLFLASASHELRTPITAIQGEIEVALFKQRQKAEYVEVLQTVLLEVRTMGKMTNDLLELSQSSVDFADTRITNVRIDELLLAAQDELIQKYVASKISIDFESLPETPDQLTVQGNDNLLRIAFRNVLDNACKFSGFKLVKVKISFIPKQIRISIIDQGIGIAESDHEQIFYEFYRAKNAQKFAGQGIGLSMVKKIVEMHKGNIEIGAEHRGGTNFTIHIPNISN